MKEDMAQAVSFLNPVNLINCIYNINTNEKSDNINKITKYYKNMLNIHI